jgi:hypothetical protein
MLPDMVPGVGELMFDRRRRTRGMGDIDRIQRGH